MHDYGVDVTVFTTNAFTISNFKDRSLPTLPLNPNEEQNGVKVRRFPVDAHWAPVLRPIQRAAYHLRLPGEDRLRTWYNGPISPHMLAAIRRAETDVICAASFPLNHLTYPFRRRRPRPPIILVGAVHTTNDWGYRRPHLIRLIDRSYVTIAHTEHERDWLVSQGARSEKVTVIGHGIDLQQIQHEPGRFRAEYGVPATDFIVAYVGQQGRHKGVDTLVRAFPALLERRPDARLVIAGSQTSYSRELRRLVDGTNAAVRTRILLLDDVTAAQKDADPGRLRRLRLAVGARVLRHHDARGVGSRQGSGPG